MSPAINWIKNNVPVEAYIPPSIASIKSSRHFNSSTKFYSFKTRSGKDLSCGLGITEKYSHSGRYLLFLTINNFKTNTHLTWSNLKDHQQDESSSLTAAELQEFYQPQPSVVGPTPAEKDVTNWDRFSTQSNQSLEYLTVTKGLPQECLTGLDHRYGHNHRGDWLGVKLLSAYTDQALGVQRLYNDEDRTKRFSKGLPKKQGVPYVVIGDLDTASVLYFCEGYADVLWIKQGIKRDNAVLFCLDKDNLIAVVGAMRERFPTKPFQIVCDNDAFKLDRTDNGGVLAGLEAARRYDATYVIPEFQGLDLSTHPTDISDLAKLAGLEAVKKLLAEPKRVPKNELDYQFLRFQYLGLRRTRHHRLSALREGIKQLSLAYAKKFPEHPLDQAIQKVQEAIRTRCDQLDIPHWKEYLVRRATKSLIREYHRKFVVQLKLLEQLPKANLRYFNLIKDSHGKYRIPPQIGQQIKTMRDKLHILKAYKDSGKTYSAVLPFLEEFQHDQQFPVAITPLKSLTRHVAEKGNLDYYAELTDTQATTGLAITINSIIKEKYQNYLNHYHQATVVDEIDAVYDAIFTGTVSKAEKQSTYNTLQRMLGKGTALVSSDDIDDQCLEELFKTRPLEDIVVWIAKPALVRTDQTIRVYAHSALLIDEALNCELPFYLTIDNRKRCHEIAAALNKKGKKYLLVTKDTIGDPEVMKFLANPNEYLQHHPLDALIGSPSITSGLSIDVDYFQITYGIYCQNITDSSFSQMISRNRPCQDLRLASEHNGGSLLESLEEQERGILAAYNRTAQVLDLKAGEIKGSNIKLTTFDKSALQHLCSQQQELSFNRILARLRDEGAKITHVTREPTEEVEAQEQLRGLKKEYHAQQIQEILEGNAQINELTEPQIKDIATQAITKAAEGRSLTGSEQAARILTTYYLKPEQLTKPRVEMALRGTIKAIRQLQQTLTEAEKAKQLDLLSLRHLPLSQQHFKTLPIHFNKRLLEQFQIEFDEKFNLTHFQSITKTSPEVKEIISYITQHQSVFNTCMPRLQFTSKTPRNPIPFLRNWLKSLGLRLISKQQRQGSERHRYYFLAKEEYQNEIQPTLFARIQNRKEVLAREYDELIHFIHQNEDSDEPPLETTLSRRECHTSSGFDLKELTPSVTPNHKIDRDKPSHLSSPASSVRELPSWIKNKILEWLPRLTTFTISGERRAALTDLEGIAQDIYKGLGLEQFGFEEVKAYVLAQVLSSSE